MTYRATLVSLSLAAVLAVPASAQAPAAQDLAGLTGSGSYLAARHAGQQRDAAAAAAYYREALKHDRSNGDLLDRTFLSLLVDGDIDESVTYAERIAQADKNDRVAELVLGVHALKRKQFAAARRNLALSIRGPITDLTATLLSGWSMYGTGDAKGAVAAIDRLAGPEWYAIFKELHAGMIYDLAGNKVEAGKRFEHAYKLDPTALRVVEAYGSWLSRNASTKQALGIYEAFDKVLLRHPLVVEAMNQLKAGEKLPPLVTTAQAGAAEALYGLGASLGRRGGEDLGLVYLQLSLYLSPNHPLALLSLADLYESLKKPALAIKAYERVSASSPLHRNAAIQMAANLDTLERADEAEKHLDALIKELRREGLPVQKLASEHALVRAALPVVRRWRPDVVHAHDWLVAQSGVTLAQVTGAPLVATVHATEAGRNQGWLPRPLNLAIHSVERWLTHQAAAVITWANEPAVA